VNEQTLMDSRELLTAMQFLPVEERLKLQGVIYGMRLALGQAAPPSAPAEPVRPSA